MCFLYDKSSKGFPGSLDSHVSLLMYICVCFWKAIIYDKCMINVLSICHTVNVFLWKIKHETLKPWNFQLTKLVTEHRFAQRSLKCETLKNGDFVAEITPSRSMIEFHLHSFALSNWNGAWKRLFADTKLFEHGVVGAIHKEHDLSWTILAKSKNYSFASINVWHIWI